MSNKWYEPYTQEEIANRLEESPGEDTRGQGARADMVGAIIKHLGSQYKGKIPVKEIEAYEKTLNNRVDQDAKTFGPSKNGMNIFERLNAVTPPSGSWEEKGKQIDKWNTQMQLERQKRIKEVKGW